MLQGQRAYDLHQAVALERHDVRRRRGSRPGAHPVCGQPRGSRGRDQERPPQGPLGHSQDQQDLLHPGEREPDGGHGPAEKTQVIIFKQII